MRPKYDQVYYFTNGSFHSKEVITAKVHYMELESHTFIKSVNIYWTASMNQNSWANGVEVVRKYGLDPSVNGVFIFEAKIDN